MIQPLGQRVLIQQIEKEQEATDTGIILPEVEKQQSGRATVIAVGEQVKSVKPNDTVLLAKFNSATPIKHQGQNYLIIEEKELVAKL